MIYNNAYRAFAGSRHPSIPGTNVLEGSHEVADFNANVMQKVYRERGMLSYEDQELTLIRDGTPQYYGQTWNIRLPGMTKERQSASLPLAS